MFKSILSLLVMSFHTESLLRFSSAVNYANILVPFFEKNFNIEKHFERHSINICFFSQDNIKLLLKNITFASTIPSTCITENCNIKL